MKLNRYCWSISRNRWIQALTRRPGCWSTTRTPRLGRRRPGSSAWRSRSRSSPLRPGPSGCGSWRPAGRRSRPAQIGPHRSHRFWTPPVLTGLHQQQVYVFTWQESFPPMVRPAQIIWLVIPPYAELHWVLDTMGTFTSCSVWANDPEEQEGNLSENVEQ